MDKPNFDEAVKSIVLRDKKFEVDAYHFLREALDQTVIKLREEELEEHRHVSGPELLEGVVEYAHHEYGSMAVTVLSSWGVDTGEDIGTMVFQLIEEGAFGRSEEDSPADFVNVVNLREELMAPFRPSREVIRKSESGNDNEPPARGNQPAKPTEI
ncbi:MAG: Minf_1886 family protein [Verrucomicrobiota bacterium]